MDDPGRTMTGNFAPITFEADALHLPIVGELPAMLSGTLYRNGPNPQFQSADPAGQHWFTGDGMIHAFTLHKGRASYRNRWVRTAKFRAEAESGQPVDNGFGSQPGEANDGVANTNVLAHAGRLLALEEAHLPVELVPGSLETLGAQDFGGGLQGPFTAHPKTDPRTGELVFFGYSTDGPLGAGMTYGTLDRAGGVTRFEHFEAPYCSMVHDFAVTDRHVLFPVLPLAGDLQRVMRGGPAFAWQPELGAHIGLIRRDQGTASLRWFQAPACYVFHVLNAWDDEHGRIVADVMQYDTPSLFPRPDGSMPEGDTAARLMRWTLDPAAGTDAFGAEQLDDLRGEFPRFDERFAGRRNRYGAFAARSRDDGGMNTIVWLDFDTGRRTLQVLPEGDGVSEPVFVPRSRDAAEGDGWLLTVAYRAAERRSELLVLDTAAIDRPPLATVQLTHRVPFGFHGNFVADRVA